MITVWGRATSSNVQSVMWCLDELGLTSDRIDIGHKFGGNDTEAFLAMNPNGRVPVLQDGNNAPIWESGAILRYLANVYGRADFWPADYGARAEVDKWAEWAKINIALQFTGPIFWPVVRTRPENRDEATLARSLAGFQKNLAIAEARLSEYDFIAGLGFSLADIQFGHILFRYYTIDIERPEHPALDDYYEMLSARPGYQDHVMIDYSDLRPD